MDCNSLDNRKKIYAQTRAKQPKEKSERNASERKKCFRSVFLIN